MKQRRDGEVRPQGHPSAGTERSGDGPVKFRVESFLAALVVAVAGLAVLLGLTTLQSLYKGTGAGYLGPAERVATAQVGSCQRLGPVSVDGFGYWWKCQVRVRVSDGRVVETVVDRSIVNPSEVGRTVDFREACKNGATTGCSYGRPVGTAVKAAVGALVLVGWSLLALFAFVVFILLLCSVLGRDGFVAVYDRWSTWQRR